MRLAMLSGKSERLKSETSDWKTPKSERPTWISSPAVLSTPAESESNATISPTPNETPAVVSAVRAGLRSKFRQTRETQVTKPDTAKSDERHPAKPQRDPARPRLGRRSCHHLGGNGGRTSGPSPRDCYRERAFASPHTPWVTRARARRNHLSLDQGDFLCRGLSEVRRRAPSDARIHGEED